MRSIVILGAAAALATSLTACSKSGTPSANPTPTNTPTATATAPATAPAPSATGTASTTIDPCQLVTQQEASQLTGTSFGPGKEESENSASKRCIYGYQTTDVFEVIVAQASTVAQAQAVKAEILAEAKQNLGATLPLTHVPGLADDAQAIRTSLPVGGGTIYVSALYVLQGTVGFALVDETINGPAPSTAAMVAQARTVLGRLP